MSKPRKEIGYGGNETIEKPRLRYHCDFWILHEVWYACECQKHYHAFPISFRWRAKDWYHDIDITCLSEEQKQEIADSFRK